MRRRSFLLAGAALAAAPLASGQGTRRIGFVVPTGPDARRDAFLQGLRELGYVEGRNIQVETRFAEGRPERLPGLIDEVIRSNIDVLVVGATIGARAAKKATSTIPIVFAGSSDPVAGGVVTNLARPEANITGLSFAASDGFAGKWLELLK
ncbi:MAG: ABC transporter substrate binding protein, partial [Burkholderiales bacterium]